MRRPPRFTLFPYNHRLPISKLRKYFPESFDNTKDEPKKETPKPVQTVASAGRSQQGRRTVKLTKSQVAIAKRLGVPLEEYARYVKEDK